VNNCGNSTITAINYTGTLTWSDAGTGNPRTVTSGTFTVTQTIDGCTSVASNSVTAAPKVIPTVSLGSDITLCADQTLMLDAGNAGGSYAWTPSGETSQTITVGVPGYVIGPNPISVSVTAPNLCSASSSVLITFDACTGIVENNTAVNMSIYPNPTTGKLTLTISGVNENVKLYIVTTNGQVIYADEFYAIYNGTSHQIDMSAFPKGIYFIKLANDNTVNVKKVVVY
jgi:hypothetical protein